jgi:hypothetical protein
VSQSQAYVPLAVSALVTLVFFFFFWWYWSLNSELTLEALPLEPLHQPFFGLGVFEIRSFKLFAQGWHF